MERNNLIARLFRAISGKTQKQFAKACGLHPVTVANIELDKERPQPQHLEEMAAVVGLKSRDGAELLKLCETLQQQRLHRSPDADGLFRDLGETLRSRADGLLDRLPRLPLPGENPGPADRLQATERMTVLRTLDEPTRLLLVQIDEDYQTWALCAEAAAAARRSQSRREAQAWAKLSVEIAKRVRGTEAWRNRVQGLAIAHEASFCGTAGAVAEARRLWKAGADPDGLLSAGGLLP